MHFILQNCIDIASQEKALTTKLIKAIAQVEKSGEHLKIGYSSIYDFVIRCLGYEERAAHRRIQAARLLQEIPEIEHKIEEGKLNLSTLAELNTKMKKRSKTKKVSTNEMRSILQSLEGKSTREAQKIMALEFQEQAFETSRIKSNGVELTIHLTEEQMAALEKAKALMSHQNLGWGELIAKLSEIAIQKYEPKKTESRIARKKTLMARQPAAKPETVCQSANRLSNTRSRHIPQKVKVEVYSRDEGRCSFIFSNGQRCSSTHYLQYDHKQPFSCRGEHTPQNLRLLCFQHHKLRGSILD